MKKSQSNLTLLEMNGEELKRLFNRLDHSKFRSSFHLAKKYKDYCNEKGLDVIEQHARDFISKRIAPAVILNDGKQTPMKNHPVFIAQHATASCCRGCLYKWYHIKPHTQLNDSQQEMIIQVIMAWIIKAVINNIRGKKMIDINLIRENPTLVKENMKKKFQDEKVGLVDEAYKLDKDYREVVTRASEIRSLRNKYSKEIGALMREGKRDEAEEIKAKVTSMAEELKDLEVKEEEYGKELKEIMMKIPNIIHDSVPIGKDDSENVEIQKYGDPVVPEYEIPYHADIIARFNGLDKEASGRTSGNGFYYLMGDIARLSSAMLSYARDFMIDKGFTYCIPPFMIRSDVVTGVMSFDEMDAMMYKIEGEDLYLIGTSEHSMIGKFKDQIVKEEELPITMTSYSPCFRKEVGAHGIEERGIYRVHQFEKQEMVVLCKPEEAMEWYDKMWSYTVELFRSLDIPVRTLECCSGDLADLKVKSCDVEAWSPRQQKYFEVGSCSTLGDAQARRLGIRAKGENGNYYVSTLNNTVLASTRAVIAFIENNYNEDGSINIPEALRPYMGGKDIIIPKK